MHKLNLNHLYTFWLVAQEGSIKKAGNIIHKTQPTITEQIKALEFQLGENLFERKNRRLHLTHKGAKIYEHCSKMFHEGEKLATDIANDFHGKRKVRIGVLPDISKHIVFQLLRPVINHPDFFLSISEGDHLVLKQKLLRDQIDIIIADSESSYISPIVKQQEVCDREFVAVCNNTLKHSKVKFPQILNEIPYISYFKNSDLYHPIEVFFNKNKLNVTKLCNIEDIALMKLITESGFGFSIMPTTAVIDRIDQKQFVILGKIPDIRANVVLQFKEIERNHFIINEIYKHLKIPNSSLFIAKK